MGRCVSPPALTLPQQTVCTWREELTFCGLYPDVWQFDMALAEGALGAQSGCPGRASDKGPRAAPVQAEIGHAALRARGLTVRTRLHRPLFRPPDTCALVPFWTVTPDSFSGIVGSCSEVCPPSLPSPLPSTVTLACLPTQHREAL